MRNSVKLLVLLIIAIGFTGCATTKDLESMRTEVERANATADAALITAEEAKIIAQDAKATAMDAKATSEATDSKIDRMFKKTMQK